MSGPIDIVERLRTRPTGDPYLHMMAHEAADEIARLRAELAAQAPQWMPIESAPRGSGEDGPRSVTDPDYIAPPKLLLWTDDGPVVGHYDWYFHPGGYGRGAAADESTWRTNEGAGAYGVTHWMPIPASTPPAARAVPAGMALTKTCDCSRMR